MHEWSPEAETREAFKIRYINESIQRVQPQLAAPLAESREDYEHPLRSQGRIRSLAYLYHWWTVFIGEAA